jgi:uroporphyrin-III C-methyltransferase
MTVHLVGAGPGSADLLTLRAAALLERADVVVIDRLVDGSVRALINPRAEVIEVGKNAGQSSTQTLINELLVDFGHTLGCVVRLKGGDPFVFGRGFEEVEVLEAAGIAVEVVPGVSSAFAAPAAAGIPVTHRRLSRGIAVLTGTAADEAHLDFTCLASSGLTLVFLMGVERRGAIATQLLRGGLAETTPVAAIMHAWTPRQRVARATLEELGELFVEAPAVIVIGAVAALRTQELIGALAEVQ